MENLEDKTQHAEGSLRSFFREAVRTPQVYYAIAKYASAMTFANPQTPLWLLGYLGGSATADLSIGASKALGKSMGKDADILKTRALPLEIYFPLNIVDMIKNRVKNRNQKER